MFLYVKKIEDAIVVMKRFLSQSIIRLLNLYGNRIIYKV